jgi:hypothetical protein
MFCRMDVVRFKSAGGDFRLRPRGLPFGVLERSASRGQSPLSDLCSYAEPHRRTAGMAAGLIQIGVTNRIRTGTNAFTGRDAAVTS